MAKLFPLQFMLIIMISCISCNDDLEKENKKLSKKIESLQNELDSVNRLLGTKLIELDELRQDFYSYKSKSTPQKNASAKNNGKEFLTKEEVILQTKEYLKDHYRHCIDKVTYEHIKCDKISNRKYYVLITYTDKSHYHPSFPEKSITRETIKYLFELSSDGKKYNLELALGPIDLCD